MARDIYTRDDTAPKYQSNVVEVSDEISFLVLQIENVLFTRKREVLGMESMGANLEDLLFTINANEGQIKQTILNQIFGYCPLATNYNVMIDVKFSKTLTRDIALIDIIIDGTKVLSVLL